jgi:hypothetical protein
MSLRCVLSVVSLALITTLAVAGGKAGDAALGSHPYDSFEPDEVCAECHVDITRQHHQAMMSQSYVHHWDEIEYFKLALPHALKEPKVAGVKAGCNGCHAPLAFLAGDIPPKPPADNTRANEGVSCDLCHSIVGFEGDTPFNFNYVVEPGEVKQGVRSGTESPYHEIKANPFLKTAEYCGTCHNEKDPFDQWVKATHLEWLESPQAKAGIVCQDCHMPPSPGNGAPDAGGADHPDVRWHLFHGAHDTGKLMGAVEVRIHPSELAARAGQSVVLTTNVVNAKAGHMIPSGSAEERVVWLHVEATDASGRTYHLPVDAKGFDQEELTIASASALAYQDIADIRDLEDFEGLLRDGQVPAGDRIFRLPYLDPQGRMTVAQWNTASFGPDYRLAPLEARTETFTWKLPPDIAPGAVQVTASVWYSRLVSSVGDYLGVPAEEAAPVKMGEHSTSFVVERG